MFDRAYLDAVFGGKENRKIRREIFNPKFWWKGLGVEVKANTKSEARGVIKRKLGLLRLPIKTEVVRV